MELQTIEISRLKTNRLQPVNRTTRNNVFNLKRSIKIDGQLTPILIDKNFVICDGHRRVECLRQLGLKEVSAIIYNGEISDITDMNVWVKTNAYSKPITGANYLHAFLKGAEIPAHRLKDIVWLIEKTDRKFLKELAKRNIAATYPKRFIGIAKDINCYEDNERFKKLILWILNNNQLNVLRNCGKYNYDKNMLLDAIGKNIPLEVSKFYFGKKA